MSLPFAELELNTWNLFQTYSALLASTDWERSLMLMAEFTSTAISVGLILSEPQINASSISEEFIPIIKEFASLGE